MGYFLPGIYWRSAGVFTGLSRGEITYGTMSVFLSLTMQVQGPILSLANVVPQFINVLAAVGRVMEMDGLDVERETKSAALTRPVGVRLKGVYFSYGEKAVLRSGKHGHPPRRNRGPCRRQRRRARRPSPG